MKIALYMVSHGSKLVSELCMRNGKERVLEGWCRISEPVEVEFPPLKDEEIIANQLAAIDAEEIAAREQFQRTLNDFKERRANLQALTHAVEA